MKFCLLILALACSSCATRPEPAAAERRGRYVLAMESKPGWPGTSMLPVLQPGDRVVVDPAYPLEQVRAGMIVVRDNFSAAPFRFVVHFAISGWPELRTQGCHNFGQPDPGFLTAQNYRGAVVAVIPKGQTLEIPAAKFE